MDSLIFAKSGKNDEPDRRNQGFRDRRLVFRLLEKDALAEWLSAAWHVRAITFPCSRALLKKPRSAKLRSADHSAQTYSPASGQ